MRLLIALLFSTALTTHAARAADITYEGADQLKTKILSYLPKQMGEAGVVDVRPGTDAYELRVDPSVLLKDIDPKTFTISGLKPLLAAIRPLADGTWNYSQSDSLDVKGTFKAGEETSDFTYKIDAFRFDGIYDPQIFYFRNAEASANGISITSTSGPQSVAASFGPMIANLDSRPEPQGKVTLHSATSATQFAEKVIDPSGIEVDVTADSLAVDVALAGLAFKPLQDIVLFAMEKAEEKTETLTSEDKARLKQMLGASLPIFDKLAETIDFTNFGVTTPIGQFGAKKLSYSINSTGLSDGAKAGFGIALDQPSVPLELVPDVYRAAVPDSFAVSVAVDNLNLESGIRYFLDHADFDAAEPLDEQESAEIQQVFLPGGLVTIRYDDVRARSAIYDVSLSGTTTFDPKAEAQQSTEMTIYAKDLDKTIAYLQQNAQAVPDFNQAAFFVMMAKGMAKQAPDGRSMWTVSVDETNKVKINGQDLPF